MEQQHPTPFERTITAHYARKVSDGNYGNEEASVSITLPLLAGVDVADGFAQALEYCREAVTAQLRRSDNSHVKEVMKTQEERAAEEAANAEAYQRRREEDRVKREQTAAIQARYQPEREAAEAAYADAVAEASRTREEREAAASERFQEVANAATTTKAEAEQAVRVVNEDYQRVRSEAAADFNRRERELREERNRRVAEVNAKITAALRAEVNPDVPDYDDTPF